MSTITETKQNSTESLPVSLRSLSKSKRTELLHLLSQKLHIKAYDSFETFVRLCAPLVLGVEFKWGKHIEIMCDKLQRVEQGEHIRLSVSMPPGGMKSLLCSVLFPAWCLGRHPSWQIIIVSHSANLAEKFSKMVRGLVEEQIFKQIFPDCRLDPESRAASRWNTSRKGVFCAFGAGANIAGNRGNVIILDDVLSEQMARSKIEREKIITWYPGGLRSRLVSDDDGVSGRIVNVATRWSLEDLTGYFLRQANTSKAADQWTTVIFPALCDERASEVLGHPVGESYWPEKWPTEEFLSARANMRPSDWFALYLQQPTPEDGAIFREDYFKIWNGKPPVCDFIVQTIDTAMTKATYSDYSVIQTWGIFTKKETDSSGKEHVIPHMLLLSNWRERADYPELRRKAQYLYKDHKPDLVLIEKKNFGIALLTDLRLAGIPVRPYMPDRDKVSRAAAITPIMEIGRVWIPAPAEFSWSKSLLDEALLFTPNGTHAHDDQIDALVIAANYLKNDFRLSHKDDPVYERKPFKGKTYY